MAKKKLDWGPLPKGSMGVVGGLHYKEAPHGHSYYWNGHEWRKSDKPWKEVQDLLRLEDPLTTNGSCL